MSRVLITESILSDVADAIRGKTRKSDPIKPVEMADEIDSIQTGFVPTGTISITENGSYNVYDYANADVEITPPTLAPSSLSFKNLTNLTSVDLANISFENLTDISNMFNGCSNLTTVTNIPATSNVTNMSSMFNSCTNLTTIDLSNFDTSSATSMYSMFSWCTSLTALDLSNFDTSSVTNFMNMFAMVPVDLDLSGFSFESAQMLGGMFADCYGLSKDTINTILHLCTTVPSEYTRPKTLAQLGFHNQMIHSNEVMALSNYQEFVDAGWSIGYSG